MSTQKYSNPFFTEIDAPKKTKLPAVQEGENDHALDDWDIETECHQEKQAFHVERTEVDICLDRTEQE
ncbi:MAG: hypothetical protein PHG02_03480 [Oscillospiraceae bacterium]|nr:hypothetical protein [Oscillospiraceae bacterium]